jgi:hypothetical protein
MESPADVVSADELKAMKRAEVVKKIAEGRAKLAAEKEMKKKAEEENLTDTDTLDTFTKVYSDLNSSITLYGELHDKSYEQFLKKFIDDIHVQRPGQKKIIIIETSDIMVQLMADFPFFSDIMSDPDNIAKKKSGVTNTNIKNPILYFSAVLRFGGSFPNTQIVCGDCRIMEIYDLSEKCKKIFRETKEDEQDGDIDPTFLAHFIETWYTQLSLFESLLDIEEPIRERYSKIIRTIDSILPHLRKIKDIGMYILTLDQCWIHLSNLHMLVSIINNMERNVDITLFVGKLHMENLIECIEEFPFEKYLHDKEVSSAKMGIGKKGGRKRNGLSGRRKKSVSVRRKKSVSVRKKKSGSRKYVKNTKK